MRIAALGRRSNTPCLALGAACGSRRALHKGHVRSTLEKLDLPRHHWLKEVDQAPNKSNIRQQKDKYFRELGAVHSNIKGLFDDDEAQKAVMPDTAEARRKHEQKLRRKEDVTEAVRVYQLLRPDADPFYEEDAMLTMQANLNKTLNDSREDDANTLEPQRNKFGDPFRAYLPVVNQTAFLVALESVVASLADDLETMCEMCGIEPDVARDDPLRFKKLLDVLFGAFPLHKDPSRVDEFMENHWPRLRLLMPDAIANLDNEVVADWLRGHLRRVMVNQRRIARKDKQIKLHQNARFDGYGGGEDLYNFSEDFVYDDDPMPGMLADDLNLDFPVEQAGEYMKALLDFIGTEDDGVKEDVAAQFQDFAWDLEKIGLRNWIKMDTSELEMFLPRGHLKKLEATEDDREVAKLMLRCAARGKANLLDFEAVDPYKLLHQLPAREIDEEVGLLPSNPFLADDTLTQLVDDYQARSTGDIGPEHDWLRDRAEGDGGTREGATVAQVYQKELDFYRTAGPVEWTEDPNGGGFRWKWRQPPNTLWDDRRQVYIPEQKGVNPLLDLKQMRQHLLEVTRCGGMNKSGRIYYFRGIVVVGNGRGVYGFGVGFGNSPKEARTDAALKALQNLDYVDMDVGKMWPFPMLGMEYKQQIKLVPRPIGRGLKANKKFYPLFYILGLDNAKVGIVSHGHQSWFTRIKAIRRMLEMSVSRRTIANMTGKRYSLLVAPGDHWIHWPDRWFNRIRQPYDGKAQHAKMARKHSLHFKKRGNTVASHFEVRPGWAKENWARWNNPLEKWIQFRRSHQPYDPRQAAGSSDGAIPGRSGQSGARLPSGDDEVGKLPAGNSGEPSTDGAGQGAPPLAS